MDLIVQKATELGVSRIVPLLTERSEVKLDAERAERRLAHWHAVLPAPANNPVASTLPMLEEPVRLANWASTLDESSGLRLALDPQGDVAPRSLPAFTIATLVVGPEGGLSEQDLNVLDQADFQGLRLGPRVLRTETAGLAAITALQAIHGDI